MKKLYDLLPLAFCIMVGYVVYAATPISQLTYTNSSPDTASFPLIQRYPGRVTNDTFRTTIGDLFANRPAMTVNNLTVTNLFVTTSAVYSNTFITYTNVAQTFNSVTNYYTNIYQTFNTVTNVYTNVYQTFNSTTNVYETVYNTFTNVLQTFNSVTNYYTNVYQQFVTVTNVYKNSTILYSNTIVMIDGTNLATVNPTDTYIPYRANASNFADSTLKVGDSIVKADANIGAVLSVGSTTVVDLSKGSQTNQVAGAMAFTHATNGIGGVDLTHVRWLFNSSGSDQTLTIPSGWRTNVFSPVPPALTNATITVMYVKCGGPTATAAAQTNCYVSFEFYK